MRPFFSFLSTIYILAIFICGRSNLPQDLSQFNPYSLLHIPLYGVLTVLLVFSFLPLKFNPTKSTTSANLKTSFSLAALISLTVAVEDEIYQTAIPGRNGSVTDVFLDFLGILLALLFLNHLFRRPDRPGSPDKPKREASMKTRLLLTTVLLILVPTGLYAFNARIETIDDHIIEVSNFSMDGRRTFSIDYKGGINRLDWKDLSSFEISRVGPDYWVEVQFVSGKKEGYSIRQFSTFRGQSDYGVVSIPFEKVKKVVFLMAGAEQGKKEELPLREQVSLADSVSRELDRITLRNGDILMGNLLAEALSIRTVYGTISFKKEDIQKVNLGKAAGGQKDGEKDTLFSKYGDKLTGTISGAFLKLKLCTEIEVSIPRQHIQEIEFRVSEIESGTSGRSGFQAPVRNPTSPPLQQKR